MNTNAKKNATATKKNLNGRKENAMKTTTKNNTTNTTATTNKSRNNGRKGNTMKKKFDIYATIADRIVEELAKGTIPWQKPWFGAQTGAYNRITGRPYSLLNQLLLGDDGEYATMKQINAEGGKVNKGAKSKMVTFWKQYKKTITNEQGELEEKTFPILKYYLVFNIEDTTLEPKKRKEVNHAPCETAEKIINGYIKSSGVKFINNKPSDRAFYRDSTDTVTVPMMTQFKELAEYYSTVFHELTHSTGHSTRLKRGTGESFFGSEDYGREELVAELGAASLVNICGLETEKSFKNNASYIESWMKAIKEDPRMIVNAACRADKAVNMIVGDSLNEESNEKPSAKTKKAKAKKATVKEGHYKKATFKIKTKDGFKEVNGYETKIGKMRIGLDKRNGSWKVTELSTGLAVGFFGHSTRDEAVKFVKKDMMDALKKFINSEKYKDAKAELKKAKKVA